MSELLAAHRQLPFTVRFEWGLDGAMAVAPGAELAVVVDVLSFTTCVSVAVDRGTEVLPSPNGSTISHELAGLVPRVVAVSLRNARATAEWAAAQLPPGAVIAVIAAGEQWPGGGLRPAVEDQLGAGAFLAALRGYRKAGFSPEAQWAADAFSTAEPRLKYTLEECSSGRELIFGGYAEDVAIAAELNQSTAVALLTGGAFRRA